MHISHKQAARIAERFLDGQSINGKSYNACRNCGRPIVKHKELCLKCSKEK